MDIERKNLKFEEDRLEFERNQPIIAKKRGFHEIYEKYSSKPNDEFKKIIENQKFVHKLLNRIKLSYIYIYKQFILII